MANRGDLPAQGKRGAKNTLLMHYTDARGKKITRPGSPFLFIIVCLVMFYGFYRISTNDCDRYRKLAAAYVGQAHRAQARALVDVGAARQLDLAAYRSAVANADAFSRCPSILP